MKPTPTRQPGTRQTTQRRAGARENLARTGSSWNRLGGPAIPLLVALIAVIVRVSLALRLEHSILGGVLYADSQSYWDWATRLISGTAEPRPFFLAPLYPYFLAGVRKTFGDGWIQVACAQACLGGLASVLVSDAARRAGSPLGGLICGLAAALFAPLILHDNLILTESVLFALGAAWVWCAVCAVGRPRSLALYAALGGITGLLALGRGTQLALLLAVPLLGPDRRSRVAGTGLAVLLAGAVLAPCAIHNYRASGEVILTTYSAGYNMAVGFGPEATGAFAPPAGTGVFVRTSEPGHVGGTEWDGRDEIKRRTGRSLSPQGSSRFWAASATQAMRADPVRAFRLVGLKALMLLSHQDYPQIENLKTYERVLGPIGIPSSILIPLVLALALAATWLGFGSDTRVRALAVVVAIQILVLVPFFVTDRYRLHLLPALLPLAAVGIRMLGDRQAGRLSGGFARRLAPALVVGLALSLVPLPGLGKAREEWGIDMDIGERALRRGRYAEAIPYLEHAAKVEEEFGRRWRTSEAMRVPLTAHALALGRALLESGQPQAARPWLERARSLSPSVSGVDALLARTDATTSVGGTVWDQAMRSAQSGRLAEAESLFTLATREPDPSFRAWGALVRIQCQQSRVAAARRTLDEGTKAGWRGVSRDLHASLVLALEGQRDQARLLMRGLNRSAIRDDPTLDDLWRVIERILGENSG